MRNRQNPFNPQRRRYVRSAKMVEQEGRCFYCKCELALYHGDPKPTPDDTATLDHKLPMATRPDLSRCMANIVVACARCNQEKGRMTASEFILKRRVESA